MLAGKSRGVDEPGQVAGDERPEGDQRVVSPDAHRQSEHALRRHGCNHYGGRGAAGFEVSLHHEAAQGMADEHRLATQVFGRGTDIVDVVGDGTRVKTFCYRAGAVSAQAQCHCAIAGSCEEIQEVVPAPRGMPTAMYKKQRHRMRVAAGPLVDHLEHAPDLCWEPSRRQDMRVRHDEPDERHASVNPAHRRDASVTLVDH